METVDINGVECVPLEDINKEIGKRLDVSDNFDVSMQKEQLNRITDDLQSKQSERESKKIKEDLNDYIDRKYSKQLKDVDSFKSLVHSKKITNENDIHDLFKKIPKQAKRGVISRFLY